VTDFGLAKLSEDNVFETVDGQLLGTPAYMSPEQVESSKNVGLSSDIYSLGATLYHALTGRPPFQAATQLETMRQIREFKLVSPRVLNPEIPVDLESICLKALSFSPSDRYASSDLLAKDLKNFLENRPTIARPPSGLEKLRKWSSRNPTLAKSISAISLLLLALLSISTVSAILFQQQGKRMAELAESEKEAKQEAIESLENAYNTFEPYFLSVDSNRGLYQDIPGTHALREELLSQFIQIAEEFTTQNPSYDKRFNLMSAYARLGFLRLEAGRYDRAIDAFEACEERALDCREEYESLSDEVKNSTRRLNSHLGEAIRGKAIASSAIGEDIEAEIQFRLAVAITDADSTIAIKNHSYRNGGSLANFIETSREFGRFLISKNRPEDACEILIHALAKRDGFYNEFAPGRRNAKNAGTIHVYKDLATTFALAADAFLKTDQRQLAEEHIDEMWKHLKVVADEQSDSHNNIMGVEFLVCQCWNYAVDWSLQGMELPDGKSAEELLKLSVQTLEKLAKRNPGVLIYKEELFLATELEKKLRIKKVRN
jgi:tetratricopeptide (TPR) repeat protein